MGLSNCAGSSFEILPALAQVIFLKSFNHIWQEKPEK
jgi:hypothetical protein